VAITHLAFQVMVGCGTVMFAVALWALLRIAREPRVSTPRHGRQRPSAALRGGDAMLAGSPRFLRALVLTAPLGFLAIEAGWVVTEVGRQPWIVYGLVRTAEAVTPMPGLVVPFLGFTMLYLGLALSVVFLLKRQIFTVGTPAPSSGFTTEYPSLGRQPA
jgi:cytochrome d ubiquinol oxidase subunit I